MLLGPCCGEEGNPGSGKESPLRLCLRACAGELSSRRLRLWTLHPRYLDPQGLVALWREALLAQAVIAGATRGYRFHPQLQRFNAARSPRGAIAAYLREVKAEADRRGYHFDSRRIAGVRGRSKLGSTEGQLIFEWAHLRAKLEKRNPRWLEQFHDMVLPSPHPLFEISAGESEAWERGR